MVEGLTTSAPGQGSGAGIDIWIRTTGEIDDLRDFSAPRAHPSAPVPPITIQQQDPGDSSGEAIPVPIPNTVVKLSSAEDTERAAFRENRSSPGFCASRGNFPTVSAARVFQ
jgi:hypothetical protein